MSADSTRLVIQGELTIFRAAELKPLLLDDPALAEVDLSQVTEIDTAGIQLLMMAKKQAQARGHDVHLVGHSPPVIDVFERLNLAAFFGDHLVIGPQRSAA
jgi:anti-anti-sigma factor